jgi:Ca2+-dependent lipid-binding protein
MKLTVVGARLTRDTEIFTKMDPFIVLKLREQTLRTKVLKSAGKTPDWDETFDLDIRYIGDDLQLDVMDEDIMSSERVGSAIVKISALCTNGGVDEWFDVQFKGKVVG